MAAHAQDAVYGSIKHSVVLILNALMKLAVLRIHLADILGNKTSFITSSHFLINLDF